MSELKKPENEPTLTESIVDGAGSVAVYGAFCAVFMPILYVLAIPFYIVAMPFMALAALYLGARAVVEVGDQIMKPFSKDKDSES